MLRKSVKCGCVQRGEARWKRNVTHAAAGEASHRCVRECVHACVRTNARAMLVGRERTERNAEICECFYGATRRYASLHFQRKAEPGRRRGVVIHAHTSATSQRSSQQDIGRRPAGRPASQQLCARSLVCYAQRRRRRSPRRQLQRSPARDRFRDDEISKAERDTFEREATKDHPARTFPLVFFFRPH